MNDEKVKYKYNKYSISRKEVSGLEQNEKTFLLTAEHITIGFPHKGEMNKVVNDVSFRLREGEILGIVGESGSGKTVTALAIMGLLNIKTTTYKTPLFPKEATILEGSLLFEDKELLKIKPEEFRRLKGKQISMIFQEPMSSLNPVMTIGYQVEEMLVLHETELNQMERKEKTLTALREADLQDVETIYNQYPHQLSGGMRQRVMIAMAMICNPKLLIADEPTTALDVTIQKKILKLIKKMSETHGTSVILISHDLGVIRNICTRACVMQDGKIVEEGFVEELFTNPSKDYTKKLIAAMPGRGKKSVKSIEAMLENHKDKLEQLGQENILEVQNLNIYYTDTPSKPFEKKKKKQVVENVSLTLAHGEVLGIVGESGCGKSTLAKAIVGLIEEKTGGIILNSSKPQMVFQDPYGSLNPAKKVSWILEEPLKLVGGYNKKERKAKVLQTLSEVGLEGNYSERYLSQLSGGQRQRVAIGVALIQNSKFIVLDEPVSALDVTVQAQILDLLKKLQKEYDLSYLFISHDLNVIYQMCDRVCVMYQGKIVETATIEELYHNPQHPYTTKLLEAAL